MYYYADDVIKRIKKANQIVVFGAGNMGYLAVSCLQDKPYQLSIEYCMVSSLEGNPKVVDGVPVVDYVSAEELVQKDALILVAVRDEYLDSIEDGLREHGFWNVLPITFESDLWSMLCGNCYRDDRLLHHKLYLTMEEELPQSKALKRAGTFSVYTAKCHVDKRLKEDITRFSWEIPIQVGAALTERRICGICDNTGENISEKNRQYCELTALYWIWKNDKSDYVGLGHYRRHFELSEEQLKRLVCSDIDVILTIPVMCIPSVEAVYRRDHIGMDWDVMMEAIQKLSPDYMTAAKEMQNARFYYAYNMFIMRREILEDYCSWLFSVLSYCEEHCPRKEDTYQNRYIGFLAERLMSIYFLHHEDEYKIVHARKHFVS